MQDKINLKELCLKIGSGATPRGGNESYKESGITLIRSQNVLDFSFSPEGLAFIDELQAGQLDNVSVQSNDVLINITGDSVARVCIVPDEYLPARVNQHVAIVRVNPQKADSHYIFYFLQYMKEYLLSLASAGATRNALTKKMLEDLIVEIPPLPEQRAIAATLSCLDDKIELNNRINKTLEEMAQAIFKSWFVDFEPWGGVMPEDWKEGNLLDIADYLNGLAMQKFRPADDEIGIPVLKIKELRQGNCDSSSELCSPNIKPEYIIRDGDVIFSWSGSLLVDFWCGGDCGLNQHLFKVTSQKYAKWFYYLWTFYHLDNFIAIAADKATTMGHIKRENLEQSIVFIPNEKNYDKLDKLLSPIYERIISNRVETRKLAEIRDALLPKLMSGEISIDIEV